LGASDALVDAGDALLDEEGISAETRERIGAVVPPQDIEIAQAYARLFLGSGAKTIPLCESVWTSPQHLLCQGSELECRKAYADAGLELTSGPVVPEDHLGLMLAFLAVTAMRAEAPKGLEFYAEHPAKFVPNLVEAIYAMGDSAGPYLGIAAMLMGDYTLMRQGQVKVTWLTEGAQLFLEDDVLTSGSGGLIPQGIVIGSVASIQSEAGGQTEYGIINPAVDLDTLVQVYIIKEFDVVE